MPDGRPSTWLLAVAAAGYWLFLVAKAIEWRSEPWPLKGLRLVGLPVVGVLGLVPGALDDGPMLVIFVVGLVLFGAGVIADGAWRARNTP